MQEIVYHYNHDHLPRSTSLLLGFRRDAWIDFTRAKPG
jgi:hypothetical protein